MLHNLNYKTFTSLSPYRPGYRSKNRGFAVAMGKGSTIYFFCQKLDKIDSLNSEQVFYSIELKTCSGFSECTLISPGFY